MEIVPILGQNLRPNQHHRQFRCVVEFLLPIRQGQHLEDDQFSSGIKQKLSNSRLLSLKLKSKREFSIIFIQILPCFCRKRMLALRLHLVQPLYLDIYQRQLLRKPLVDICWAIARNVVQFVGMVHTYSKNKRFSPVLKWQFTFVSIQISWLTNLL